LGSWKLVFVPRRNVEEPGPQYDRYFVRVTTSLRRIRKVGTKRKIISEAETIVVDSGYEDLNRCDPEITNSFDINAFRATIKIKRNSREKKELLHW
jgi:hypothetical protein